MKTFLIIFLSSLTSAAVGSLLIWIGLGLFPGSTGGFDFTLYLGILCVAAPVIFVVGGPAALIASSLLQTMKGPHFIAAMGGIGGAMVYLCINVVIALISERDVIGSFFRSGAFLFSVIVGFVFGGCFGYAFPYFRLRLGK